MMTNEDLDSKHKAEIKAITEEIAAIRAQRESFKKKLQERDDECSIEILALTKKRLKLINEGKYGE